MIVSNFFLMDVKSRSNHRCPVESMQTLNKDYGLEAGETIASNLKIFLTHIGEKLADCVSIALIQLKGLGCRYTYLGRNLSCP